MVVRREKKRMSASHSFLLSLNFLTHPISLSTPATAPTPPILAPKVMTPSCCSWSHSLLPVPDAPLLGSLSLLSPSSSRFCSTAPVKPTPLYPITSFDFLLALIQLNGPPPPFALPSTDISCSATSFFPMEKILFKLGFLLLPPPPVEEDPPAPARSIEGLPIPVEREEEEAALSLKLGGGGELLLRRGGSREVEVELLLLLVKEEGGEGLLLLLLFFFRRKDMIRRRVKKRAGWRWRFSEW